WGRAALGAVAEFAHEAVEFLLVLHPAELAEEFLEVGAHRLEPPALLVEPLQLRRPVIVERGVAGTPLEAKTLGRAEARRALAERAEMLLCVLGLGSDLVAPD